MTLHRWSGVVCALVSAGALAPAPRVHAATAAYVSDQVIVKPRQRSDLGPINSLWRTAVVDSIPAHGVYLLQLEDPSLLPSMKDLLDGSDDVEFCDYNFVDGTPEAARQIVVVAIGDSTTVRDQAALDRIRLPEAQTMSLGSGTLVAILDTGVDFTHSYLAGHLVPGYDYVDHDADASETANGIDEDLDGEVDGGYGHGTMVAGIVATVAPEAQIIPFRVLNDEGYGTIFGLVQGMYAALDAGADVVNLSLGFEGSSEPLADALSLAQAAGVLVVAAAGNDSASTILFPADDLRTVAVTATDSLDVKADFANWSPNVDVSAPGVGVFSSYRDGGFGLGSGTSFAAPFASGLYALLRSRYADATASDLTSFMMGAAVPIDTLAANTGFEGGLGSGRVDCLGALVAGSPLGGRGHGIGGADPATPPARALSVESTWPNPAGDIASIRFSLAGAGDVRVEFYDAGGRRAGAVSLGRYDSGSHTAVVHLNDAAGRHLAPGVYQYVVRAGGSAVSGRLTIRR